MKTVRSAAPRLFLLFLVACVAMIGASGKATKPSRTPTQTKAKKTAPARAGLVDVNHASIGELMTLPGIGEAYAEKIARNRPYANKTQLASKGVLPAATYKTIKGLIIAKQ